jgi:protein-tyrosine phosphatase
VEGLVAADGIAVRGTTFSDPTAAMAHVLGETPPADAGWEFWKVDDPERGFTKPLEHVRTAHASRHEADTVRDSDTHPLRINGLRLPGLPGEIGMTFCPGKKSDSIYGGRWNRDLEKDLGVIRAWGAAAVVTLLEDHEFDLLGVPEFPEIMGQQPFAWHLLRIRDSDIPGQDFEAAWPDVSKGLHRLLARGERILIHCRGGLGRTGLVAARLLTETGLPPEEAIFLVREARPGAIETWEQRQYVRLLGTRSAARERDAGAPE